jgi:steroid delta-isomerase-like uncharacterized protein
MSANADRARRWYHEVWRPGGEATVRELMAEGATGHMEGAEVKGQDAFLAQRRIFLDAFPDLDMRVEDVIADGDKVVVRWHVNATHTGGGLGMPPSNRKVSFRGITWLEFESGRLVRGWDSWNLGALLQSLAAPQ